MHEFVTKERQFETGSFVKYVEQVRKIDRPPPYPVISHLRVISDYKLSNQPYFLEMYEMRKYIMLF